MKCLGAHALVEIFMSFSSACITLTSLLAGNRFYDWHVESSESNFDALSSLDFFFLSSPLYVQGLYAWRDRVARKEDESTGYVLPNQLLFRLGTCSLPIFPNLF
jgi:hypothetical protein